MNEDLKSMTPGDENQPEVRDFQWFVREMWDLSWDDDLGLGLCMACDGQLDMADCPKHGPDSGCFGYLQTGKHDEDCPLAWLMEQPEWPGETP